MTVLFPLPPSTLPIYLYPSFLLYILTSQILQCVAMNLTLIYSLLAYSSIRQRDFSGLYVSPTACLCASLCTCACTCVCVCIRQVKVFSNSYNNYCGTRIFSLEYSFCFSVSGVLLMPYFTTDYPFLVQMVQQRPVYLHVWPPLCSFIAYLIAWYANGEYADRSLVCPYSPTFPSSIFSSLPRTLPIVVIMIPFGVYSVKYRLVQYANNCSCWCVSSSLIYSYILYTHILIMVYIILRCLPFFGNMVPRPPLGVNINVHVPVLLSCDNYFAGQRHIFDKSTQVHHHLCCGDRYKLLGCIYMHGGYLLQNLPSNSTYEKDARQAYTFAIHLPSLFTFHLSHRTK